MNNDYRGAILDFDEAIEIDPNIAIAFNNRGGARYSIKDYIGALDDYNKAIELAPDYDPGEYENRADVKMALLDYGGAIADFTRALERKSGPSPHLYVKRGNARRLVQDYNGAIADLNKAIEFIPCYALAFGYIGIIKMETKDYKGAIDEFNKALECNPNSFKEAYYYRGLAKICSGQNESGCLDLIKARESGFERAYEAIQKFCK